MNKLLLVSCISLGSIYFSGAQEVIYFDNGSFEGEPADATIPVGWHECEALTTPDILPGVWGVYTEPSEGDSYVGLITRSDGSFESIGQRLKKTLHAKECYQFKLDLAHSNTYSGFGKPVKLRIWGGETRCKKSQLIFESDFINHLDWKTYSVLFFADKVINYIILEAHFNEKADPNRGNILIDNLTFIKKCDRAELFLEEEAEMFLEAF